MRPAPQLTTLDTLPTMRAAHLVTAGSLLAGLFAPLMLVGQSPSTLDDATAARADKAVESVIAATGIPSASIALVEHGQIVYVHAYGKARREPPMPAMPEMPYSVGSVSKQFTSALILMLAEDGKMTL